MEINGERNIVFSSLNFPAKHSSFMDDIQLFDGSYQQKMGFCLNE